MISPSISPNCFARTLERSICICFRYGYSARAALGKRLLHQGVRPDSRRCISASEALVHRPVCCECDSSHACAIPRRCGAEATRVDLATPPGGIHTSGRFRWATKLRALEHLVWPSCSSVPFAAWPRAGCIAWVGDRRAPSHLPANYSSYSLLPQSMNELGVVPRNSEYLPIIHYAKRFAGLTLFIHGNEH